MLTETNPLPDGEGKRASPPPSASPAARPLPLAEYQILAELIEASPAVALRWRLDPGWPVEYVSQNIRRFGYEPEELLSGKVVFQKLLEPLETQPAEIGDTTTAGSYRRREFMFRTRTHGRLPVRLVVRTVVAETGALACEALMLEVPENSSQERLRLLEQAVETAQNGILIADAIAPDLPIIFANHAVETISGYTAAEFLGRNCRFLQAHDRDQPALAVVRKALREKRACHVVLRNYRKDGTLFWNEIRLSPVANKAGVVTHFVGIQADITARKQAEAALARRDAILEAVSNATETLLRSEDYQQGLAAALRQLGEITGSDRVCVWRHRRGPSCGAIGLEQIWSSAQVPPCPRKQLEYLPWDSAAGWPTATELRSGKALQGTRRDCSPAEQRLMDFLGVRSYVCLPIFEGPNRFWGLLSLGCVADNVRFSPLEIEALLSATRVLGALVHNHETSRALRVSEQRFRTLSGVSPVGIFEAGPDGRITYVNQSLQDMFRCPAADFLSGAWVSRFPRVDLAPLARAWRLAARTGQSLSAECRLRHREGFVRWIKTAAVPLHDADDRLLGYVGTVDDITDYQLASEATRASEAKYRTLVSSLKEVVFQTDHAGVWTFLNPAWTELTGYTVEETLGQRYLDFMIDEDRVAHRASLKPLRTGASDFVTLEARYRARDGSEHWMEVFARGVYGSRGDFLGATGTLRDVTDRRRAEARLQQSLEEKDIMLKEIHHRVKNNMQIVSSLLNLQLDQIKDPATRALFVDAQTRIGSMALVHEKLYQASDLAHVDFPDYIRDLTGNLVVSHDRGGSRIRFQLESEPIFLGVDTAIPCGLLMNELVSNAYRHAFPDGREGTIQVRLARSAPGWLHLEVADTGCGLPADLDIHRTRSLGMQLITTLVRQLRGTIDVQRASGTCFRLDLQEVPARRLVV